MSDKADFKKNQSEEIKKSHYILIKETEDEDDGTIPNVYAPNIGTPSS
jgi:hypothetical protein